MTVRKIGLIFLATALSAYLIMPYYSSWRMLQAVKSGSAEQMQRYIDFPRVQASIKQQIDVAWDQQLDKDPMVKVMAEMFRPLVDKMVEELLQAENLAQLINSGKLSPQRKDVSDRSSLEKKDRIDSWYAFFDRPTRFRIVADEAVLYMELQGWQWRMTAIGMNDLIDMDRQGGEELKELVADSIDTNSSVPPMAVTDIEALKADIRMAFFIVHGFGDYAQVEGDFHYSPAMSAIKPIVTWIDARDANDKPILGEYSQEEMDNRTKYHWGNNYYQGKWSDKLPKISSASSVVTAKGICRITVPTQVDHFSLASADLNVLKQKNDTAATLTAMANGNVSLSYYTPFDQVRVEPVIIVRNAAGQPLRTPSTFSSVPDEPIDDPRFAQAMFGVTTSITVSGTPASVDVYLPYQVVVVENSFTATRKPEVSFGEIKSPISRSRYAAPLHEPKLKVINLEQLKQKSRVGFHEETSYDKSKKRYLKVVLPDVANSAYARADFSALKITLAGKSVAFKPERHHNRDNVYRVYFMEDSKDYSGKVMNLDHVEGVITIRYPAEIEVQKIMQGENRNGIHLNGPVVSAPKDGPMLPYFNFFSTRSILAYGGDNRQLAYLESGSMWNNKMYKEIFWGSPDYVEVKQVRRWIELKLPVKLGLKELQVDKEPS